MECNCYKGYEGQRWGHISYAQHGDDFMVLNLHEQLGRPLRTYLDIGAHHPTRISNTRLLYDKGWRGVNVEANPHLIEEFNKQRPEDINVNVGLGIEAGVATFYMYDDESGLNTFDLEETQRNSFPVNKTLELPIVRLNHIVNEYCAGRFPTFLNCDVEGLDFQILHDADFSKSSPLICCVEVREHESEFMCDMMADQGFVAYCRCGENIFFIADTHIHMVNNMIGA